MKNAWRDDYYAISSTQHRELEYELDLVLRLSCKQVGQIDKMWYTVMVLHLSTLSKG